MTVKELKSVREKFLVNEVTCVDEGCDYCPRKEECEGIQLAVNCINDLIYKKLNIKRGEIDE